MDALNRAVRHRGPNLSTTRKVAFSLAGSSCRIRSISPKLYQARVSPPARRPSNPGPEWTTDKAYGKCLPHAAVLHIRRTRRFRAGVACAGRSLRRREFGVPDRIANVDAAGAGLTPS